MSTLRQTTLAVIAAAALAACSSMPAGNVRLDQARSDYRGLQGDPLTQRLAPAELRQAGDALALAEAAQNRREDEAQVDQLAYVARQRVALAREAAARKSAEETVAEASAERDRLRLAARTREADASARTAAVANREAASSQQQAAQSQQQAGEADRRSAALEAQLRELKARKTDRGMVVTIGDVLFDSGQSQIKPGGARNLERLGAFLKAYPQRRAQIEGYTDSVGSDEMNLALSDRRATAVMDALVDMGVARSRLSAKGFGEERPVSGNDTSGGRQANRRVEIVLPDDAAVSSR